MSDEPTPELRALAARLFAAGRAEEPSPALGRRLQLLAAMTSERAALSGAAASETLDAAAVDGNQPHLARGSSRRWWAMAAVAAVAAGVWWLPREQPSLSLSPDPRAPRVASERITEASRAANGAGRVEIGESDESDESGESGHAVGSKSVVGDAPSSAPLRRRAEQPGARERALRSSSKAGASLPSRVIAEPSVPPRADAPASAGDGTASPELALLPRGPEPALSEELARLKEARRALRAGDAVLALALLDAHGRVGAEGDTAHGTPQVLRAEATLLRIEALAASGRRAEASALAERFVHDSPNSALEDRAKSFIIGADGQP